MVVSIQIFWLSLNPFQIKAIKKNLLNNLRILVKTNSVTLWLISTKMSNKITCLIKTSITNHNKMLIKRPLMFNKNHPLVEDKIRKIFQGNIWTHSKISKVFKKYIQEWVWLLSQVLMNKGLSINWVSKKIKASRNLCHQWNIILKAKVLHPLFIHRTQIQSANNYLPKFRVSYKTKVERTSSMLTIINMWCLE